MRLSPSQTSTPTPPKNLIQRKFPQLYAFWKFARPHTIVGTSLSVLGLYLLVGAGGGGGFPAVASLVPALIACLCGNIYIVGLNQLEDVEIDRVNKPHLPLASGEYSRSQAGWIVGILGLVALILSAVLGPWLMAMVWLSLLIGTLYSLPPVRLKRFPVWAALCIFSVRGAIVNLGLFLHFSSLTSPQVKGTLPTIPPEVWALTAFILVFTFAIAIFKDIPDLEGDRRYHISTFTLRLGAPAVFNLARWVLTVCYVGMIAIAPFLPGVNVPFLIISHLVALAAVWVRSRSINLDSISPKTDAERGAIARYYQFIWKLFFLEYLMFPLAYLLGAA